MHTYMHTYLHNLHIFHRLMRGCGISHEIQSTYIHIIQRIIKLPTFH